MLKSVVKPNTKRQELCILQFAVSAIPKVCHAKISAWKCNLHWQIMTVSRFVISDEASFHFCSKVIRRNVWKEFEYLLDVGRVTNGAHIEHL